jgi:insertion element IS1 protein InsB
VGAEAAQPEALNDRRRGAERGEGGVGYTNHYAAYTGVIPSAQHRAISTLARTTNYVERFNCTLRQRVSRLVRATLSFSKKLSNHIGAIKYFIRDYNLTKWAALPE